MEYVSVLQWIFRFCLSLSPCHREPHFKSMYSFRHKNRSKLVACPSFLFFQRPYRQRDTCAQCMLVNIASLCDRKPTECVTFPVWSAYEVDILRCGKEVQGHHWLTDVHRLMHGNGTGRRRCEGVGGEGVASEDGRESASTQGWGGGWTYSSHTRRNLG